MNNLDSEHNSGEINNFLYEKLLRSKDAVDLGTWVELVDDAKLATKMGVTNESEFSLFHYVDVFVDDVARHVFGGPLVPNKSDELKQYMFDNRNIIDFNNLDSFFACALKWVSETKGMDKKAYPNRGGHSSQNIMSRDLALWTKLALIIRQDIARGMTEITAVNGIAERLPEKDRLDFIAWFRFKHGKYNTVYDINQRILNESEGNMNFKRQAGSKFAFIHEDAARYYIPDFNSPSITKEYQADDQIFESPIDLVEKERKVKDHMEARSKLVSRTFAIDRLLEKYHGILGDQAVSDIEDTLNVLRKKIRGLRLASSVKDTMIKTANTLRLKGFSVGAAVLESEAHQYLNEKSNMKKVAFDGAGPEVAKILQTLQQLSNDIKRRDMVKEIARIDLQLHDLNAYALFPELGEAQAKLIDATTYASNKLEDVIPKLRSLQQGKLPPVGDKSSEDNTPSVGGSPAPKKAPAAPASSAPLVPEAPATPAPPAPAPKAPTDGLANSI